MLFADVSQNQWKTVLVIVTVSLRYEGIIVAAREFHGTKDGEDGTGADETGSRAQPSGITHSLPTNNAAAETPPAKSLLPPSPRPSPNFP